MAKLESICPIDGEPNEAPVAPLCWRTSSGGCWACVGVAHNAGVAGSTLVLFLPTGIMIFCHLWQPRRARWWCGGQFNAQLNLENHTDQIVSVTSKVNHVLSSSHLKRYVECFQHAVEKYVKEMSWYHEEKTSINAFLPLISSGRSFLEDILTQCLYFFFSTPQL